MEAGVSPSLLSMIVRGRVPASENNAAAVARALGKPQSELFPFLPRGAQ
jgi:hypothetical protein